MEKDDWINSILDSASDIKEAGENPYLYNRIMSRIKTHSTQNPGGRLKLEWIVIILAVIAFNISSVIIFTTKKSAHKEDASMMTLSSEINTGTTYFY